jgi:hypothetical protein
MVSVVKDTSSITLIGKDGGPGSDIVLIMPSTIPGTYHIDSISKGLTIRRTRDPMSDDIAISGTIIISSFTNNKISGTFQGFLKQQLSTQQVVIKKGAFAALVK